MRVRSTAHKIPSEHAEQASFVAEFRLRWPAVLIFAIPNGGHRSKVTAALLKAEGVIKGVPDLYVPSRRLWIEMKRRSGGSLSPEQREVIEYLRACGDTVIVAKGADDAMDQVRKIFAQTP